MISIRNRLLALLPNNPFLYRACKNYVDRYNSENNGNILTNGELRFMRAVLPNCITVFDVGANIGDWTALALRIKPHLQVHCFEPSAATFQRLLAHNFPSNVVCTNVGMGSTPGEAKLFLFEDGAGINSLYRRHGLSSFGLPFQQFEETVRLDTIDHYCEENGIEWIDFVKVDVEGHELEVFRGMSMMLASGRIKTIQFEYGGCNIDARVLLRDLFAFFEQFEYTFYKIYPKKLRRVDHYDQQFENFQYQNWAIIANRHSC